MCFVQVESRESFVCFVRKVCQRVRFLCTCERCAPRFVAKKNWRWRREMTINDLFRFERGKTNLKRKKKLKNLCGPEAPISGFVKDQSC